MVFSHGRIRPSHRHSVLDLDVVSAQNDSSQSSPNSSIGSIQSTSSFFSPSSFSRSSKHDKISYNSSILHKIKLSGLRITPEEVYQLRRELQEDFVGQKGHEAKRGFLLNALNVVSELRNELKDSRKTEEERAALPFFVFEYQALICWLYSEIRFAPYMSEMQRHFDNLKKEHSLLLSSLPPRSEAFLLCVLRFSHLCLEYAPFCDDEALQWIKTAAVRGSGSRKKAPSLSVRSMSSVSSAESLDDVINRREDQYKSQLLHDLRIIINEIELAITLQMGSSQEKRID